MSCPNLFIIGMPKCGTTALAAYLQKHPDVLMSIPKEPNYFDAFYDEMSLDEYCHKIFRNYSGQKILGEATPGYLSAPWALERLSEHFPKAKYIALLRNPIDRAYSHWWMYYSRAMEPLNFEAAINVCMEQTNLGQLTKENYKKLIISSKRGGTLQQRFYLEDGYYAKFISNFFKYFDPEQLLIIKMEDFNRDAPAVMEQVYHFLGISAYREQNIEKHNEAYSGGARRIFKIVKGLGLTRFTQSIPESIRTQIKKVLSKGGNTKPTLDPKMRARLSEHFAPYNQELEKLLHRNFNWK
jgi:hypothetical protein